MPQGGVLARFYRPGGLEFRTFFCPWGEEFANQKKCPGILPGWGGGGGDGQAWN